MALRAWCSYRRLALNPAPGLRVGKPCKTQIAVRLFATERSSSDVYKRPMPRQVSGIWYIPDPLTTDPSSIISKLPQLWPNDRQALTKALFLASPRLAHWFERGNPFLQTAMNWMYTSADSPTGLKPISYVAIVDGLPAPEYFQKWKDIDDQPYSPAEGIAICLLRDVVVEEGKTEDQSHPAVLRIMSARGKSGRPFEANRNRMNSYSSLTVPLANTLFVNGAHHTAFKAEWKSATESQSLVLKHEPISLRLIQFSIPRSPRYYLDHFVPLHALTAPRKVISTMGNVIREVEGDDGKPLRASAELEAMVPKFLTQYNTEGQEVPLKVFAKVVPPNLADDSRLSESSNQETSASIENKVGTFAQVEDTKTYWGLWFNNHFYRVTSGGGGWGKKAGLLSLDPARNFEPPSNMDSSIFPDFDSLDADLNEATRVSALVPAGSTIQFFAARVRRQRPPYFVESAGRFSIQPISAPEGADQWAKVNNQKVVVGTMMPNEAPQVEDVTNSGMLAPVLSLPGCFGAMSEGGASLAILKTLDSTKEGTPPAADPRTFVDHEFRIDAPHSLFSTEFLIEPAKFTETAQNTTTTKGQPEDSTPMQVNLMRPVKTRNTFTKVFVGGKEPKAASQCKAEASVKSPPKNFETRSNKSARPSRDNKSYETIHYHYGGDAKRS